MNHPRSNPAAFPIVAVMMALAVVLISLRLAPAKKSGAQNVPTTITAAPAKTAQAVSIGKSASLVPLVSAKPAFDMAALIARVRTCLAETNPEAQAELEQELEVILTDANAAKILRALPPDLLASPFAAAALRHWVNADRQGAAGWVAVQTGLTEPEQTSVIYGWGKADKPALDAYLNNLPAGEWKQRAVKFAANDALAAGSPKDAIDLLGQMDPAPARDDLLNWSATAWAQADATAALAWANSLADTARKQAALGAVAVGLAWGDPAAAGRLLAEQVSPGAVLDRSALSVVCVWSQSDPQAAANWVAQFPAGGLQQTVLQTLMQRWAAQDFSGATSWVSALPNGLLQQTAAQFLAAADANLHREESAPAQSPND